MDNTMTQTLPQKDHLMEQVMGLKQDMTEKLAQNATFWKSREQGMKKILGTSMSILGKVQAELDQKNREIARLKERLNQLEEISTTDSLTGLKNRRGFEQNFNAELDRVKRERSRGGVLLVIDMDNFKAINDTFGHDAGDACLKLVGKVLNLEVRDMDTAARLGGDEFIILMTDTTADVLLDRIQAMIWKLNNLSVVWNNEEIRISASIGMKPYDKSHSAAEIFSGADRDMYVQKQRSKQQH